MDLIFEKDGKEYSVRQACALALADGKGFIDMTKEDARDALERLGYRAKEEKKSILRSIRRRVKRWIRNRLMAVGRMERYFR